MASTRDRDFLSRLAEQRGRIAKVAAAYCANRADREDLVAEITAQLWHAWKRFDPARSFSTWMYRIALNVAISHARRDAPRRRHVVELACDPAAPSAAPDERQLVLQQLIASLDELDRALLVLWLEDKSYAEIAEVLGISETNVGTKLNRIKERLRAQASAAVR